MESNKKMTWEDHAAEWTEKLIDPNNYYTRRSKMVTQFVNHHQTKGSVLDVGCGSGQLLYELAQEGYDVFGTDLAENMIVETSRRLSAINLHHTNRFRVCQDGEIPFNGYKFDLITGLGVLPYIADWPHYIQKLSGFLNPNGLLVLSCNNRRSLYILLNIGLHFLQLPSFVFNNKMWRETLINLVRTGLWSGGHVDFHTAIQCYSPRCMDHVIRQQGFIKVAGLDLYNIYFLDRKPFQRNQIARGLARMLAWNHIGMYRKP